MDESKKEIYLVTGVNESYLPKASAYIETMHRNSNVRNIVITLDFEIPEIYREEYRSVRFVKISSDDVKSPNSNSCMQHGGFLSALDFVQDDDIIIYTDSDIKMQRGFSAAELDMLGIFGDDCVGASYNESDSDYLSEEAKRLKPNVSIEQLEAGFPSINKLMTYNTGVVVANYRTYGKLYDLYNRYWEDFKGMFKLAAKQQWLLSYLIGSYFKPKLLPALIHTHGKYPVSLRVKEDAGYRFLIGSEMVVFNHAIRHEAEHLVWRLNKQIRRQQRRVRRLYIALISLAIVCAFLIIRLLF